jgi:hypothetical protein
MAFAFSSHWAHSRATLGVDPNEFLRAPTPIGAFPLPYSITSIKPRSFYRQPTSEWSDERHLCRFPQGEWGLLANFALSLCFLGDRKPGGRRSRSPQCRQRAGVFPSSPCPREDRALERRMKGREIKGRQQEKSLTAGLNRGEPGKFWGMFSSQGSASGGLERMAQQRPVVELGRWNNATITGADGAGNTCVRQAARMDPD